jgi:hypothetical protein
MAQYAPPPPAANPAPLPAGPVVVANVSEPPVQSKPHTPLCDRTDAYGGHAPASLWGTRAFWEDQTKQ